MSSELNRKKDRFKTQIRKETFNKLLGLKRIKPKLIESDQEALIILVDGLDILKRSQNDEELVEALKSMTESFKKYDHKAHQKLIRQSIENVKWLIRDPMKIDIIKEQGIDLLTILCFNYPEIMTFSDFPIDVLQGFNLKSIRLTLIGMCQILMNFKDLNMSSFRQIIMDTQILKRLNIILSNYSDKKQCFQFIKTPFISFAVYLCYISYNWNINRQLFGLSFSSGENDFLKLLDFCTVVLEKDVVAQGERDCTFKIYFEKLYVKEHDSDCYYDFHSVAYPFGLLGYEIHSFRLVTKMIQQVNVDVLQALNRCLDFQIENNTVQKPLVTCLTIIFKETTTILDEQLRDKIFKYIFEMKYVEKENQGCIKEIMMLAVNNSVNEQSMTETLFEAMRDRGHKRYPETCHLLELMEYLEERKDFSTQSLLMKLVQNYITFNGSTKYIEECQNELLNFQQGLKMLEQLGVVQTQVQNDNGYDEEILEI